MSQVIVTEVQMDGEEVAEMVLRGSASETMLALRRVRGQIQALQDREKELMEALVKQQNAIETLGRRNAVKRQIHSALMYTATGGVVRL